MLEIILSLSLVIIFILLLFIIIKFEKLRKEQVEKKIEIPSEIIKSYAEISAIKDHINETKKVVQDLSSRNEERKKVEEERSESIKRLEKIVAGVYSK